MSISFSTIRRRYDQGLDSIVRLVIQLEDRIEDLSAMHVSTPQNTIRRQLAQIKQLKQTINNKDKELTEAHQLNVQLQTRICDLERSLEADQPTIITPTLQRDSHNSNQPPSLDLPWKKPKRTRSLRKQSGLKVGGQTVIRERLCIRSQRQTGSSYRRQTTAVNAALRSYQANRYVFPGGSSSRSRTEVRRSSNTAHFKRFARCAAASQGTVPCQRQSPRAIWLKRFITRVYLHLYLPVARTQETMRDLFGCDISQASILRAARLCSAKLIRCEQRIKAAIREAAVIGADETGIRISGANAWVHVARTEHLTHLAAHTHRGKAAFDAIGNLNQYKGTLVRDGWFSYKWYQQCRHSLCNSHLLRDLTYIGEAEPQHEQWTSSMAKLLIEIKEKVEEARNDSRTELDGELHEDFSRCYDAVIAEGEKAVRGSPEQKSSGLTAGKLLKRFIRNKVEVLRFMTDFAVPFDNNGSERDLRMLKLQQKIAGCFRTIEGGMTFCRVRSYLSSAKKQGRGLLTTIERALNGKPITLNN